MGYDAKWIYEREHYRKVINEKEDLFDILKKEKIIEFIQNTSNPTLMVKLEVSLFNLWDWIFEATFLGCSAKNSTMIE